MMGVAIGRLRSFSDTRLESFGMCALLALAIAAAYSNIYGNAFLYDDLLLITGNSALLSWRNVPGFF